MITDAGLNVPGSYSADGGVGLIAVVYDVVNGLIGFIAISLLFSTDVTPVAIGVCNISNPNCALQIAFTGTPGVLQIKVALKLDSPTML